LVPCVAAAEVPKLFREQSFNCATLAEAVNHFVAIGEEAAAKELEALSMERQDPHHNKILEPGGINYDERIRWVCRILFQPRGDEPLRQPYYGGLKLPWLSMPLKSWPLYPVAASGSSYFILSEGYSLGCVAEPASDYIAYCRKFGRFRRSEEASRFRGLASDPMEG
jgi:hypothetical protein